MLSLILRGSQFDTLSYSLSVHFTVIKYVQQTETMLRNGSAQVRVQHTCSSCSPLIATLLYFCGCDSLADCSVMCLYASFLQFFRQLVRHQSTDASLILERCKFRPSGHFLRFLIYWSHTIQTSWCLFAPLSSPIALTCVHSLMSHPVALTCVHPPPHSD